MPKTSQYLPNEELPNWFVDELRKILRSLYDPGELSKSSFLSLLPIDSTEGPNSLQRLITSAIEDLHPSNKLSLQSDAWRIYNTLTSRFIQGFKQSETAVSLGVSLRQMGRIERQSIYALASHIWNRYNVSVREINVNNPNQELLVETPSYDEELEWIKKSAGLEEVNLESFLSSIIQTIEPYARSKEIQIKSSLPSSNQVVFLSLEPLRQAWINLLIIAIQHMDGGVLLFSAVINAQTVEIRAEIPAFKAEENWFRKITQEDMGINSQLILFAGGKLNIYQHEDTIIFNVSIPLKNVIKILVIDDNIDTLKLIERYLEDSKYLFVGVSNPKIALSTVLLHKPFAVILDLAIPEIDGWELLSKFREHPDLKNLHIIICSILPQEPLSLALGASAFLRKPINQNMLLTTLDRLSSSMILYSD